MPYEWVDPDIFLTHNGVTIYHVYRHDYESEGYRSYWYGYAHTCNDDGDESFDVRELPNYNSEKSHEEIIMEAIDNGWITGEGVDVPSP